jgi:hypothetical protein
MSIALANQQLLYAEQQQLLCRDETLEALRFYPNIFVNYDSKEWSLILATNVGVAAVAATESSAAVARHLPTATVETTPASSTSSSSPSSNRPLPSGRIPFSASSSRRGGGSGRRAMDVDDDDDDDDGTGRPSPRGSIDEDDIDFVVVPSKKR